VKPIELGSIFFIYIEMDEVWVSFRMDFYVWVVGLEKLKTSPKWVKPIELKSIFFICIKMSGIWVALDFYCLSPNQTDPHMEANPYS